MMIKAKHHFLIYPFFQYFTLRQLKKKFHKIEIVGKYEEENHPVLVIANHISWWDGFWLMYLNLKMLHRRFHFMMLEEQLHKHWYFNFAGGYSIRKKSRSILETLKYTAELLECVENMVFIFPQGEIKSMHDHTIMFEPGIENILNFCNNEIQIIFIANLVEYFSHPKPSLFMHIKVYNGERNNKSKLQIAYNTFYQAAIEYQKSISD